MAQAALAIPQHQPANDNPSGPRIDKWHWLIRRLTDIHTPLGVCAAQHKLKGWTAEQFSYELIRTFEYLDAQEAAGF